MKNRPAIVPSEFNAFCAKITALEAEAAAMGLHFTRRALNRALNSAGWELAGNLEQATKAAVGDRS